MLQSLGEAIFSLKTETWSKRALNSLILASNSPRRRELLALGGWNFIVQAAEVDERLLESEAPPDYVLRLAKIKAEATAPLADPAVTIIAADTTVADRGAVLGKPADSEQAVEMLRRLRGRTHSVYTGIAVLRRQEGIFLTDLCETAVKMRDYSEDEIAAYVASGDPLDKAGAYAIQSRNFKPVPLLSGCYASVMGLPLCHLGRLLARAGMPAQVDLPAVCQKALHYECDFYPQVWNNRKADAVLQGE